MIEGDWLAAIARDAETLEVAARAAGPDAAVPSLPRMDGHRRSWSTPGRCSTRASLIIGEHRERRPHRSETTAPPGDPFGWFEQGRTAIVPVLRAADPSADYWTFRGPNPLRWWLRRLANETAVHRVDAEQAAGWEPAVDAAFAADGIDEKLETYLPVVAQQQPPARPVTVALRAHDVGATWTVTVGNEVTVVRGAEPAEATVAADAAGLYLWWWQRAPDGARRDHRQRRRRRRTARRGTCVTARAFRSSGGRQAEDARRRRGSSGSATCRP